MQGQGAIMLYDNAAQRGTFVDDGRLDDPALLLTDQLAPAASFLGFTVMEWQWQTAESIDAVAFWGTSQLFLINSPVVSVERWTGTEWEDVAGTILASEPSVIQPAHLVFLLDDTIQTTGLRVAPLAASEVLSIGSVQIARALRHPSLVDDDWSVDYVDIATTDASAAGQIYASEGKVSRRVTISHTVIPPEIMHAVPDLVGIGLGPPDVSAGVTLDAGTYQLVEADGLIKWTGAIEPGNNYALTYDLRIAGQGSDVNVPVVRLVNDPDSVDLPVGNRALHFTAANGDLTLDLSQGGAPGIASIGEISLSEASISPSSSSTRRSLSDLIAISGRSKPIGLLIRPSNPLLNTITSFYGLIDNTRPYSHRSGDMTAGGMTIVESLG